jgi:hypothetical protein
MRHPQNLQTFQLLTIPFTRLRETRPVSGDCHSAIPTRSGAPACTLCRLEVTANTEISR